MTINVHRSMTVIAMLTGTYYRNLAYLLIGRSCVARVLRLRVGCYATPACFGPTPHSPIDTLNVDKILFVSKSIPSLYLNICDKSLKIADLFKSVDF